MNIKVAASAGFCFGVKEAVRAAEEILDRGDKLTMLGAIVHNQEVVDSLLAKGADLVEAAVELDQDRVPGKLLIRAHGIPPEEYRRITDRGYDIVDKTCPFVSKIQKIVAEHSADGQVVLVAGDLNHPEVVGIVGNSKSQHTYVVNSAECLTKLLDSTPSEIKIGPEWLLVSQTTFSVDEFARIKNILQDTIAKTTIFDTICYTTACRQKETEDLAKNSDLFFVIGSENSSNTAKLVDVAKRFCRKTYLIQRPAQVSKLLKDQETHDLRIGITAGASTPVRMIREVIQLMSDQAVLSNQEAEVNNDQVKEELLEEKAVVEETQAAEQVEAEAPEQDQAADQVEAARNDVEDENEQKPESAQDNHDIDFTEFIESIPQLKRGTIVKGRIVRYDDDFVYVDVRDKTEGKIARKEFDIDPDFDFDQAIADQEEMDVYVRNIRNTEHEKEILLSKARVDFAKHRDIVEKAFEEKTPLTVKITNVVKDGVIASFGSVDLYIHRTQLEFRPVDDLEAYRGQTMDVLISQFDNRNPKRLRVSGSRRSLLQRERHEKSKKLWEEIEVGKEYEGVVRNLTDFGAFVDIGGVDGLVHISELSWSRIKHPSEVVNVGDHISVFVRDFDKEKKRVSLGFKREENDPYYQIEERFPAGSIVRGVVVRMFPFGAFVEIAPGVDALCHISQISDYRLNRPNDVLKEGMEVDARVIEVSNADRKISISIKEVEPINPAEPIEQAEERRQPRRNNRNRQDEDKAPTTYTDTTSGSSLSSVANITFTNEEAAEAFGFNTQEEAEEE